ncbi:amino acid transporter [Ammoniphilus resinae]|uniref:Uncharacterized protein n=1 Tax=Ammoniphilus resinae TaxID=861532 RepID=A0ABS4GNZ3_9BACL|nr:amino acid transporter [Ammoniphilus resinae]MBP1932000.1 hypothetical protein [Ammoniphilus resinae]
MNDYKKFSESETEVKPFNDVTDHYQKHVGLHNKSVNLNTMTKWLQIFWYFIMGVMAIEFILLLISWMIRG